MRELRSIQYFFIAALLTSCASSGPSLQEQNRLRQLQEEHARFTSSINPTLNIEEIRESIWPSVENYFEVLEDNSLHEYIQARLPHSGVLFGLYFENGILTGLIVEKDVTDFHILRSSEPSEPHWMSAGFSPYREWVMSRNKINTGIPEPVLEQQAPEEKALSKKSSVTASEVIEQLPEAIAWVPVLIILAPLITAVALEDLAEKRKSNTNKTNQESPDSVQSDYERERQQREKAKREAMNSLQIGTTEDRLVEVMEQLGRRVHINRPNIYTYWLDSTLSPIVRYRPSYSFGVMDGKVIWLESCSMLTSGKPPTSPTSSPNDWSTSIFCGSYEGAN